MYSEMSRTVMPLRGACTLVPRYKGILATSWAGDAEFCTARGRPATRRSRTDKECRPYDTRSSLERERAKVNMRDPAGVDRVGDQKPAAGHDGAHVVAEPVALGANRRVRERTVHGDAAPE